MSSLVLDATGLVPGSSARHSYFPTAAGVLLFCAAYYVGAMAGIALGFPPFGIAAIWPPTAILLAALLLTPARLWWVYLVAVVIVHLHVVANFQRLNVPLVVILSQVAANAVHAILAALAVRAVAREACTRFDSLRSMAAFILLAVIAATAIACALGVGLFLVTGWATDFWLAWRQRVFANVFAIATITPLILLTAAGKLVPEQRARRRGYAELGLLTSGLLAASIAVFGREAPAPGNVPALLLVPLPFLLWAAVRLGPGGLCFSLLLVASVFLWNAFHGRGPFVTQSPAENVLSLQVFLIAISLPLMLLAALMEERRTKEEALEESEERFRNMADYAPVMVWITDPNASANFVSKSWYEFTGQTPETALGFGWLNAVHPDDREYAYDTFVAANNRREPFRLDYRLRRHDGENRWVIDSAAPRFGPQGDFLGYIGSVMDITERKRVEARLNTQYVITRILSESASMAEVVPRVLQTICEQLDCEYGEIWRINREANVVSCVETWHLPLTPLTEFESASRPFVFPFGLGLPGRVWQTGKPVCMPDVTVDPDFLRPATAASAGLRGALGFPILSGDEVLGVIVLFAREIREADKDWLEMMTSIGSQMGQFIERKGAEERNNELLHRLGERVKELTALHGAARILQNGEQTTAEWLQQFVAVLPPAWQYPEITAARIQLGELEFATPNFKQTAWTQRADFSVAEGLRGAIEVVYLEERPAEQEGAFLTEERNLIESLAEVLRSAIERKRAEQTLRENETALRASYARIRDLAGGLITAQEAERSRIAGDLHDDVNQQLAGLSIALSNVKQQLKNGGDATVQDELTRLQQRTIDLADVIRSLSHELHPGVLQHAGLSAALKGHCAEFGRQHAIEITLSAAGGLDGIPQDVALCLYRVAQEALRNIAAHAGARKARVTLSYTEDALELVIADDGQGFNLAEAEGRGGLGLISLDERVRLVGGSLTINTQPQRGTEVRVQVPLGETR